MFFSSAIIPVLAATAALASPVDKRMGGGAAVCKTFYADITASAQNLDIKSVLGGPPANQQAQIETYIESFRAGSTLNARIAAAPLKNITGTYSLWFEYCAPTNGAPQGIFQTAHGLVGNAGYWNVKFGDDTRNSFASYAASYGWATLSYDRLGVGRSAHPDGLDVVQIAYEIAQAAAINARLRAGTLDGIGAFKKIVGVGHSYGSIMMSGAASVAPTIFDAIVLTGYSANVTSGPLGLAEFQTSLASYAYPARFGSLSNSYVSTPNAICDQLGFFAYPNYTQQAFAQFTATKGEYTLGQAYSIGGPYGYARPNFTKPVFVITGDKDTPFCTANCTLTSLGAGMSQLDTARPLFPAVPSSMFKTYVVPDTAHGINFHTTAYSAYAQIVNFVLSMNI